ncbi:HET-domain-containing protein [Glonium stellatum]|uniref:HET-domain-containing protein n=1 Tax=Glonium stellatum TaxID=574774 RepID=A0A8E2FDE9_9PEZI|nr:HET-domain-containing protein [Glonium stellatum]
MRLLHTSTLEFQEFLDTNIPRYAILSHTWGTEEVTFEDMRERREAAMQMAGYEKIKQCCKKAAQEGFDYVWIDTCCIDKRSSAELSESMNAMYEWYRKSGSCYAYLADVPSECQPAAEDDAFRRSRWFTRGWTLQELIAPDRVQFFAQDWTKIGTKETLNQEIKLVTGIPLEVLNNSSVLRRTGVAQKMSWAASRQTARVEDIAYCLMGLFGVNMPMLYGEGQKAFQRLQLEIIKKTYDHSIFAWKTTDHTRGLFACSPADFVDSGHITPFHYYEFTTPYSVTNLGLSIKAPMASSLFKGRYVAYLNCGYKKNSRGTTWIGIYLRKVSGNHYTRISCDDLGLLRQYSSYFRVTFKEGFKKADNSNINLVNLNRETFELSVKWLHARVFDPAPVNKRNDRVPSRRRG